MSMLSEILATKRTEVQRLREHVPVQQLQERLLDVPPARDFRGALRGSGQPRLIAEVKKASPSKGVIRADFDPIEIALAYAASGASCLSVLTDEQYFQGRLAYLSEIRAAVDLPLLRKDFIVDAYQIVESRLHGADAILLIVAALCPTDLRRFLSSAEEYGLAALVEVHDAEELREAVDAGADFIGINNRDLHTFRTSLKVTLELIDQIAERERFTIVSESGIFTHADVLQLHEHGVDAILVGEAFMREADIGAKVREILGLPALVRA